MVAILFFSIHEDIRNLNPTKIIFVSDKGLKNAGVVEEVINELSIHNIPIEEFTNIVGEPDFEIVQEAIDFIQKHHGDLVIGLGGGSALDVAKASAALVNKEPIIVEKILAGEAVPEAKGVTCILVPTTSGTGSEVTMNAIFGDHKNDVKRGIVSPYYLPDIAIIDPVLTVSCPPMVSAASGVDAFTHAIESYVSKKATPLTKMYAEAAMKRFSKNISKVVFNGSDLDAREEMSWVSFLAGVSLANAGVGAVHALAYPLGGKYNIAHGVANALLLPYVFNVTGKTCIDEMVQIADFLHLGDFRDEPHQAQNAVVDYLYGLLEALNLPKSLKELHVVEDDLRNLAIEASKVSRLLDNTPFKLNMESIHEIYQNAYDGTLN
ncbi:iron-containing alcohol dehydrogenase [Sporosarcina thermotolerans]|uniref:iron-containing alcohol dehydrogenase n=1 Tax=Sporosarcina thermotolerans TaxID=633404 RepID=UPI0024BC3769|nr:iron-containing alcohol dehydrogenase [Sporosarcina thermotolerans]WHT48187.1 iron-containing alcohol dehydrogenase [Sporosarcina thermotolerans]